MDMITAVRTVLNKYATFSGRARRAEYWWWTLALILASIAVSIIETGLFPNGLAPSTDVRPSDLDYQGPLSTILSLATLLPSLAVAVRRLHDVGKSGWWIFIALVPLIGFLYLLYLTVKQGDRGTNFYGADPLDALGAANFEASQANTVDETNGFSDYQSGPDTQDRHHVPDSDPPLPDQPSADDTERSTGIAQSLKPAAWRTPSTGKGGFKTTQDRFKKDK